MMSLMPAPAAKGTRKRTGRLGHACASAACEMSSASNIKRDSHRARVYTAPAMKLRIAENFRAVFYAPFYAIRALGLAEREGLEVEWLPSDAPAARSSEVKRGAHRRAVGRADARAEGP